MKNNKGFLLLEVLVSICVLTGGILFVMRVYGSVHTALKRSGDLFDYSLRAEEKIFEYEINSAIEPGESTGPFAKFPGIAWRVKTEPVFSQGPVVGNLVSTEVRVFSEREPAVNSFSIWTYFEQKK